MSKTTYDWDNMLGYYNFGSTGKQDTAVAKLVYQCGVAVDMAYSLTGSSSTITKAADAFVTHFGYDNEIQRYDRLYYSNDEWNALMRRELDNARPVNFYANSEAGGHSFVCDGYDSNNLFHINWGWGGSSNGYFELSSLSTNNPGVTGAAPEFCYFQSILANIHKEDGINRQTHQLLIYKNGVASSVSSVSKINTSSFSITYSFVNFGTDTTIARMGVGFIKEGSSILTKLVENNSSAFTTALNGLINYNIYSKSYNISNPSALSTAGKYRLYPIYMPKDSTSWSIMRSPYGLNSGMVVTVASNNGSATILPILAPLSMVLTGSMQTLSPAYLDKTYNVDLTIKNNGGEFLSRIGLCLVNATNPNDRTYICESKVNCEAGETKTFHLSGTITAPPGNYFLQAQFDSTNSNSTMNYKTFGPANFNNLPTEVLPTPGPAVLQLNEINMPDGIIVSKTDTISLTASITNAGGYYDSRLIAFVFPKAGGRSLTFLNPKYVYIDSLQTVLVTLSGAPNLEPGEYSFSLYNYQNNTWNLLSPSSLATIYFTVSDGSVSVKRTNASFRIRQEDARLRIETDEVIEHSKLYDLAGRLVRKTSAEKEIPVGDLVQGVYLLQVTINGKNRTVRFLKH
jgi:hypothetical protein